ncbi:ABC transporter permease [soil metagenome]
MSKPTIENSGTEELPVHIYAAGKKMGPFKIFLSLFKEFSAAHALGFRFAERNIRARYRQSVFGMLWAFLPPLATALIWIILNKSNVIKMNDVGVPYPVFVITGTMLWSVFSNAMLMPMQVMQANRGILVKINFPREALLINAFYEILFNTCITFVIIILELLLFHVHLSWNSLLFVPGVFLLVILGMSFGLLLLPLSFLYKDVQFALPTLLQFAMYLTPVVYAKPIFSGAIKILKFNPISPVLTSARAWLLGLDTVAPFWQIGSVIGIALFLLFIGLILQRITIEILIERMGS